LTGDIPEDRDDAERDINLLGLVGLYDPPRIESKSSVAECHVAGINVHMLTGDHPTTAKAIAMQVGIVPKDVRRFAPDVVSSMIMTAQSFDRMTDEQIDSLPVLPLVIARCTPQTKVRMIEALHRRKAFCAMTGNSRIQAELISRRRSK
jgi:magnesium-transporting ATPase (P-type)